MGSRTHYSLFAVGARNNIYIYKKAFSYLKDKYICVIVFARRQALGRDVAVRDEEDPEVRAAREKHESYITQIVALDRVLDQWPLEAMDVG